MKMNKILNIKAYWVDKNELIAIIDLNDFKNFENEFKKYILWGDWGFGSSDWKFYKYKESLCCCEWIANSNYIGLRYEEINIKDKSKLENVLEIHRFNFQLHKYN